MFAPVPSAPTLPVASSRTQAARTFAVPTVFCVRPMHQISVAGFWVANISATLRSCAPGTPVTFSTSAGVHFATSLRTSSMPCTRWRMNSLSSQPFWKLCQSRPQKMGMSVPGRRRTCSVACAAVRVKRGSITIRFARFTSLPERTCCSDTGCASAGLPPMMIMVFDLRMSL